MRADELNTATSTEPLSLNASVAFLNRPVHTLMQWRLWKSVSL
jgi:hypothetical protein